MAEEIRGIASPSEAVYVPQAAPPPFAMPSPQDLLLFRADVGNAVLGQATREGDGFAFDAETLERLANKWEDFTRRYRETLLLARDIVLAEGPGLDYASVGHAEKVRESGDALREALEERVKYCADMRDKFLAALGGYTDAENDAEATVTQEKGKFE
ncbi:hypothetical protein [Saccharomonospora cyanea]|uniref:hypothetical protein n=1 Tax=Saccharomonospora cyanea TaxID=40989 RepID=UPI0002F893CA|nr:hypothetical protein [Saccharomonospora cyanea]